MPNTPPPPTTVWAEDADPGRPPPRTEPPRHAQERAAEVFDRVAGGTRTRRRGRWRLGWWWGVVGAGLVAAGAGVWWAELDLGLMRVPSVAMAGGGLVLVVKTLLGYR